MDLQQRMAGAVQRIAELEATLVRSNGQAGPRPSGMDDTRAVIRDTKGHRRTPRMSPRSAAAARSPGPVEPMFIGGPQDSQTVKTRMRHLLDESEEPMIHTEKMQESPEKGGGKIGAALYCPTTAYADIMQALGVQTLPAAQVHSLIQGAGVERVSGYDVYAGSFRGTPVSVWRLTISESISTLEVHRAYSRFCTSHPHVCSLMGICVEPLDTADPMEEDGKAAADAGTFSSSAVAAAEHIDAGCHLWVVEERHGEQSLARWLERGLLSWQHVLQAAADVGSALACLQSLKRLAPVSESSESSLIGSSALSAPLSPLAVAQMIVPENIRVSPGSTAKLSLVPALLGQLEFSLGLTPAPQRAVELNYQLVHYIHPSSMFGSNTLPDGSVAFDGTYGYGVVLLQLMTEQQAPGLLGSVQQALQAKTLSNIVPRTPAAGEASIQLGEDFAALALRCSGHQSSGAPAPSLEAEVLPAIQALAKKLEAMGPAAMSWEQVRAHSAILCWSATLLQTSPAQSLHFQQFHILNGEDALIWALLACEFIPEID